MKWFILTTVGVLSVFVFSCRKADIRTAIIYVPEMKNNTCIEIIHNALSKVHGIQMDKAHVDLAGRTVTVRYESLQLALKNIEFAIAEAGFKANEVPANPEAEKKLPPECK